MMKKTLILGVISAIVFSCGNGLPEIAPTLKSEKLPHDSDDPAIWINHKNPEQSIVLVLIKMKLMVVCMH